MKISVIGAGYVGLTTAACLAQIGHDVFCSESDSGKLQKLQSGIVPIFEPHLETIVQNALESRHLAFGSTERAIDHGEAIFICVGTPPLANGDADLSAIELVARTIAKRASGYRLVVEKSTVPVQTGAQLHKHLRLHRRNGLDYDVASNPEFLREGSAVEDFLHPDRIVVGVDSPRAAELLRKIYEPVIYQNFSCPVHASCDRRAEVPILVTDTCSSELIKHASNSFLAMKISFINMVADLCEAAGANISRVAEGVGLDPRIGSSFLRPGIGFGGFCFPKDLQAFVHIAEKQGCDFTLLKEVERINQSRVDKFVDKVKKELWVLQGKRICIWGLAFKPNTDDVRFAPALAIIRGLLAEGAHIQAYDPQAMETARREVPEATYCRDLYDAAKGADGVLLLTEWEQFRHVDWQRLASVVERCLIIDGRNMLSRDDVVRHGFEYVGIGGVSGMPEPETPLASATPDSTAHRFALAPDPDQPGTIRRKMVHPEFAKGVSALMTDNTVHAATLKLLDYCRSNDWAGYEPYDVLNSKVVSALPFLDSRIPRLVLTQALKRSPINIRGLLRVPKTQNPKALGLFLSALVKLSSIGVGDGQDIDQVMERLVALRSQGLPYWCWGYNFPWQTRVILVPRWAPNLVCTTFAAIGLLDVYEQRRDERCLSMALSAAQYLLNELYWSDGKSTFGFGYPLPWARSQVHNANLLAADLFCRVYKYTGDTSLLEPALNVARYSVAQQHEDGGWDYGEHPTQKWIDNFHTGFNLCALRSIARSLETTEFEPSLRRGFDFYRAHFFREDGAVRYFHDRTYPIDTHCIAQSIITLLDLKDLAPDNVPLARSVFRWAMEHMWDERGFFYYRVLRLCTIRTSYMRWTQAWMFLALSQLLAETATRAQEAQAHQPVPVEA